MSTETQNKEEGYSFTQKVLIAAAIVSAFTIFILLVHATFNVFLLVLAGAIVALFFRGLSSLIQRLTNWKPTVCLLISVLGVVAIVSGLVWVIGDTVQSQVSELSESFPATLQNAKEKIDQTTVGHKVIENLSSKGAQDKAKAVAGTVFTSTFGVLGDVYVVLFLAMFFTVSPMQYKKGILQLTPPAKRQKADEVLNKLEGNLKKWLKGKLFAMLVVFILTAIGLVIIGVPTWIALALIAGALSFIPNFGPIIAMVLAVLVAWMQSPQTAAMVAGLYVLIQLVESNFITPFVQKKLVKIPPALIIVAQLLMATLTGGWGIILATPIMIIAIILIQELYVKKLNDEESV